VNTSRLALQGSAVPSQPTAPALWFMRCILNRSATMGRSFQVVHLPLGMTANLTQATRSEYESVPKDLLVIHRSLVFTELGSVLGKDRG